MLIILSIAVTIILVALACYAIEKLQFIKSPFNQILQALVILGGIVWICHLMGWI